MSSIVKEISSTIKSWWLYLIFGVLMVAFSIWVWTTPLESYVGITFAFSILVFANGVSLIFFSTTNREKLEGWGWYLTNGILEVIIGLVLLIYPGLSITTLPFIVGFWLMIKAGFIIGAAFDVKRLGLSDWVWLLAFGILLGLLAFIMILHPVFGALTIVGWTGLAFMLFGVSNIVLGLKLKKLKGMTLDKADDLKAALKKEAAGFKEQIMQSLADGGEEAGEVKKNVEKKVDDFLKNLD